MLNAGLLKRKSIPFLSGDLNTLIRSLATGYRRAAGDANNKPAISHTPHETRILEYITHSHASSLAMD
jgi:hypothetical protein